MKSAILLLLITALTGAKGTDYPQTFEVTEINNAEDYMVLETSTGYMYEWEGVEDYMVGDIVSAIMNDNGTADITDDDIICIKYSGF